MRRCVGNTARTGLDIKLLTLKVKFRGFDAGWDMPPVPTLRRGGATKTVRAARSVYYFFYFFGSCFSQSSGRSPFLGVSILPKTIAAVSVSTGVGTVVTFTSLSVPLTRNW